MCGRVMNRAVKELTVKCMMQISHNATTYLLSSCPYARFSSIVLVAMDWSSNPLCSNFYKECVRMCWSSVRGCWSVDWISYVFKSVLDGIPISATESVIQNIWRWYDGMYLYISWQMASGWSCGTTKARFTIAWSTFIFTCAKASDRKGVYGIIERMCMAW